MSTFREKIESGHFTMEELKEKNLVDTEILIRQADKQERPVDPEILEIFNS